MSLPLTPDLARCAYDLLCETPPFNRWNLPDGHDVAFHIVRSRQHYGRHWLDGKHHMELSAGLIGTLDVLLSTVGHEMIHIHEARSGTAKAGVDHGAAFRKWAAQVCKSHLWDLKNFI